VVLLAACRTESAPPVNATPTPKAAPAPASTDVTDELYVMRALPHARVTLTDVYGGKHPIDVELATDNDSRTRGLMWRKALADGVGMLFIFPGDSVHSFWMRNTLIPLDMLFITVEGTVAGIVENATPQTLSARTVGKPSRYVLEVPGGWCEQKAIKAGSVALFEGLKGLEVR
jgi:uncharacterized membrane protein (UPF0127 family)